MMIMTRRTIATLLVLFAVSFVFALPFSVFATTSGGIVNGGGKESGGVVSGGSNANSSVQLVNPLGSQASSLPALVTEIMQFVVRIGAIVVVFMLVYTGYLFVVAQGNEKKITDAREALKWVVIGALILLGAQAISIGICETANALSTGGSVVSCSF